MSEPLEMRWLGVAGIALAVGERTLLIDPFVSRPPVRRLLAGRVVTERALVAESIPPADVILVTHAHWDHLMDVPEVAHRTGAAVYGSPNVCALLRALGVPRERLHPLAAGDRLSLGEFTVEVWPAEHPPVFGRLPLVGLVPDGLAPPLRLRDYRMDLDFSFAISAAGYRLLDWSSTRAEPAVAADVLFIRPFGTRLDFYADLFGAVRPQLVIPIHWDDFLRPLSKPLRPMWQPPSWSRRPLRRVDLAAFRQLVERLAPEASVFVPEIFHVYDLGALLTEAAQARR